MLTGRDDQAVQREAIEHGVYRNLVKPVDVTRLEAIVSEAVAVNTSSTHAIAATSAAESVL
jgi:AmiR/NasT family two-component response regulator